MLFRSGSFALTCIFSLCLLTGCANIVHQVHRDPIQQSQYTRTWGGWADDRQTELVSKVNLLSLTSARIVPLSFNGYVVLVGQVPDKALRDRAEAVAREVRGVRQLFNELQVKCTISLMQQIKDAWLTTTVKTRMLFTSYIPSTRVRVTTEDSAVYLMGLVTPEEARRVTQLVQKVPGVTKVVKAFEYPGDDA